MPNSVQDIYGAALDRQQNLLNASQSGYAATIANLEARGRQVTQGYNTLSQNVLGELTNLGRTAAQNIADQYSLASGQTAQSLTNRGLGNTTVADSLNRGLAYDKAKADVALQESVGDTRARYMTNIGLSGLNYQGNLAGQISNLGARSAGEYARYSPAFAGLDSRLAQAQLYDRYFPFQWMDGQKRLMAGLGQANARMSGASRAASGAGSLANRQLGYKYDALAAENAPDLQGAADAYGLSMQRRVDLGRAAHGRVLAGQSRSSGSR